MNKLIRLYMIVFLGIPGFLVLAQPAQETDQIYEFVQVEDKPVIQSDVQPVYPKSAIDAGIDGTVVVTVVIDREGNVSNARIFRSVPELDDAALTAARGKKFRPGMINGSPVITRMNIPIAFSLDAIPPSGGPAQRTQQTSTAPVGDVVDLSGAAVIIKAEPDRPRVNIISDRIKPRFDNINLDKSFLPELKGEGEHFVIRKMTSEEEFETIEIKNLLNKTR